MPRAATKQPPSPGIGHNQPDTPFAGLFAGRSGVSIAETSAELGVERDTIHELINRGELVAIKLGRRTVIEVASIHRLVQRNRIPPKRDAEAS